jgi:hypothetical protein
MKLGLCSFSCRRVRRSGRGLLFVSGSPWHPPRCERPSTAIGSRPVAYAIDARKGADVSSKDSRARDSMTRSAGLPSAILP